MAPPSELQQNGAAVTPQLQDTAAAKLPDDNRELSRENCPVSGAAVHLYSGMLHIQSVRLVIAAL